MKPVEVGGSRADARAATVMAAVDFAGRVKKLAQSGLRKETPICEERDDGAG